MDHQSNNHHNHAGNSFLLGLIVGGVATLLFTTKKGREIVREITDRGLEKFSDLEIALQEEEFDEIEGSDYIEPAPIGAIPEGTEKIKLTKETKKEVYSAPKTSTNDSSSHKEKAAIRRFFKGSKKN